MSYGSGTDHSDDPSDRDASRDSVPASPGPASTGIGRAWSAVQVSRPADLLAAAQAIGGDSSAPPGAQDAAEPRPASPAGSPAGIATGTPTADAGSPVPGMEDVEAEAADPSADADLAAGDEDDRAEIAEPGDAPPRLPGSQALAAAVAGSDRTILGRAARVESPGEAAAGPVVEERRGKKGRKAKRAAKVDRAKAAATRRDARARGKGRDRGDATPVAAEDGAVSDRKPRRLDTAAYERELAALYIELVKMQEWVKAQGLKVVVIFEGRDAAGKGGVIKRITEPLNPRYARVVALPAPTEREKGQWYFQRYVAHLPAAGEMVFFDRSWYNRAGVDRVMGFCTDEEYREFARSVPEFERMLVRSGIMVVKYWFSVSDEEQERRFRARINDPTKRWKLSPMDLQSRARWVEYSRAKDEMFTFSDIKQAPWYVVPSDDKKRARLNCIAHLLSLIPYEDLTPEPIVLPPRQDSSGYVRPPITDQTFVPERY